jgi:hypothetical protein
VLGLPPFPVLPRLPRLSLRRLAGGGPGRRSRASVQATGVDVREIDEGVVALGHGEYRAVLEVDGTNFGLQGDEEQDALLAGYAAFLNGLSFPVQIVVRVLSVDVEGYVGGLERQTAGETGTIAELARDHVGFVRRLARHRALLERRFYLVVPAAAGASRLRWPGRRRDRTDAAVAAASALAGAHRQLRARCEEIERQLGRCGLRARRLQSGELARLYYACWCPELARVQRLQRRLGDYATPVVRAAREPLAGTAAGHAIHERNP